MAVLWIKTFHVLFVVSWLAGIFYLPRILVNIAQAREAGEPVARLLDMGRRLFRFTTILAAVAIAFGLVLWLGYGIDGAWLHWKLVFVLALVAYHIACRVFLARLEAGDMSRGPLFFRIFNEAGVLIVFAILVFAIVKPV
jgi:putative membrane protein